MTDVDKSFAAMFSLIEHAWAEPEQQAARATATPQPMYANLHSRCPVSEIGDHLYTLVRMDDILYVTKHPDVRQIEGSKDIGSDALALPLVIASPEHRLYRRLLDPVLTAKRVAPLAQHVRTLANELIDSFIDQGHADVYSSWCGPLPATIFMSIMGLPMQDLDGFIHVKDLTLGNDVLEHLTADQKLARKAEAVTWVHEYLNSTLDRREQEAPRDDMIGWLMSSEVDGRHLNRRELLDIIGLLMIAGLDTVAASLACFLSYFGRHPEQRARIVSDPALIPSAVEELMRFESPVTEGFRSVTKDITLPSGAKLPAGSHLVVSWSGANVDPAVFDNPLVVDLERKPNPQIGFASGYHRCPGSHLARMEMRTALEVWHERIPNYSIEPGVELVYSGNPRAPHKLPVVWA